MLHPRASMPVSQDQSNLQQLRGENLSRLQREAGFLSCLLADGLPGAGGEKLRSIPCVIQPVAK